MRNGNNAANLLTPEEVCEQLAISRRQLKELRARDELPAVKIGNRNRFRPEDIDRFIAARYEGRMRL